LEWKPPGAVDDVWFAPDGRHVITANSNGTAYVLRLEDARAASTTSRVFTGRGRSGLSGPLEWAQRGAIQSPGTAGRLAMMARCQIRACQRLCCRPWPIVSDSQRRPSSCETG